VSSVVVNVAIGLLTSIVSGGLVWVWQRLSRFRRQSRRAAFLGLSGAGECVIVIGHQMNNPHGIHRADVNALVEVASIVNDVGARFRILQPDQFQEGAGGCVEFCLNGPDSNSRTAGHLATHLPGVTFKPYEPGRRDSIAIAAGNLQFIRERTQREYVVLAKITPGPASRPVFLLAGQTAVANHAAAHYMRSNLDKMRRDYGVDRRFCLILAVDRPEVYGHESVRLERDISDLAFIPRPASS
jgi:hypothetical protein